MTQPRQRRRRTLWLALPVVMVASAWLGAATRPVFALAPVLGVLAIWLLARAPFSWLMTAGVLGAALVPDPSSNPMQGRWRSPLYAPGKLIYDNLNTSLGLGSIHLSLLEVGLILMLVVLVARRVKGEVAPLDPALRPLFGALAVCLLTVLGLELFGLARGGDVQQSLWQMRQLLWLPVVAVLALHAFSTDGVRRVLVVGLVAVTVIRGSFGLWYWLRYCRPVGFHAHYITTHSDSVLYVLTLVLLLHGLMEYRDFLRTLAFVTVAPFVGVVMILNDRRLAYVALIYALLAFVLLLRRPLRRIFLKVLVATSPLLLAYVAVGLTSHSKIFAPVQALHSVGEQQDSSSKSREVEDLNLVYTLHSHPLFGRGFGHPYEELIPAYDLSQFFKQYRFLPHNSVLWLLTAGGLVGFSAIWMVLPILLFIGVRAHRFARTSGRRVVAMAAVVAVIAFEVQAFGDIGLQDWLPLLVMTALGGAAANLAVATGALGARASARIRTRAVALQEGAT